MQISNVPVGCQICREGLAYGKETHTKHGDKILIECVWICSKCSGVAKRHSEIVEKS